MDNGCNVLIADLALRPEAQAIVEKHAGQSETARAIFQQTDVTDWSQLDRMFEIAEKEFGEIDLVCPGAGVYEPVCVLCSMNDPLTTRKSSADQSSIGVTSGVLPAQRRAKTFLPEAVTA